MSQLCTVWNFSPTWTNTEMILVGFKPPVHHTMWTPCGQLTEKCLKAQHNASCPPPHFLCSPLCRPLTEFLLQQKTTDEAIMADMSSSLSCPVQTNKDRGSCWRALWWWDTDSLLSASAGPQDAAESWSYIHSHSQWQPVNVQPQTGTGAGLLPWGHTTSSVFIHHLLGGWRKQGGIFE